MIQKLAYEWKTIYRLCTLHDADSTGEVTVQQFEKACSKQKVSLSEYEMKKVQRMFGNDEFVNYKQMSIQLGLHKESYNYLQKIQQMNQIKSIAKMKQMYNSIESPREKKAAQSMLRIRSNQKSQNTLAKRVQTDYSPPGQE